jgi:O-antigen/teichoic acid export membrane protein
MPASSSNQQVAKNTLILYVRMLLTMVIGMCTSRIVLNALGFTDQGIYNVVAGFIGFSTLITGSISGSINRFITFALGAKKYTEVNLSVQNGITVQCILALIVLLAGETIGLWFVANKLVIPEGRELATHIVYQISIANLILGLLSSTDNALIIANEKFNIFAYISIANSLIALVIAFAIKYSHTDRLILYAFLQFLSALAVRIFYSVYVHWNYPMIKRRFGWNKGLLKPMFTFAGWNSIGTSAAVFRSSGTSVLLNMFGGPVANTINGIAGSVANLATLFVNDFTSAYSPQITKRYAAGEYKSLITFLHLCSKFSYCMIAAIAIPLMFNTEVLLKLWLKNIPAGTVVFARLIIVFSVIECVSKPLICAKNASGNLRNYQIAVGGILLFTLPLTYTFFFIGLPIYFSYISIIITSVMAFVARMLMLRGEIPLWSTRIFISSVILRCFFATVIALTLPTILFFLMPAGMVSALMQCLVGSLWAAWWLYRVALNEYERQSVKNLIRNFLLRIFEKAH